VGEKNKETNHGHRLSGTVLRPQVGKGNNTKTGEEKKEKDIDIPKEEKAVFLKRGVGNTGGGSPEGWGG